jgi:hypothetical protein
MIATPRTSGRGPLAAARVVAAAGAALSFTILAQAQQPVRVPDFRYHPPAAASAPRAGEPCDGCGVIRAIREVQSQRPIPVPKPLQGEAGDRGQSSGVLVGAVVALPMGAGSSGSQPFVGGVGTPEMRSRFTETTYEIIVRFDSGAFTSLQRSDGASFRVGDRVRVHGVQMVLLAP